MKNQVNKKVSKLLIALLSLVIMSVACVSLAACNKECTHSKFKLSEDTATCVAGGFITHTCEDCGYAYMEPTPAKGHDYGTAEVVPATCTTDGYTVKTCKTCGFEEKIQRYQSNRTSSHLRSCRCSNLHHQRKQESRLPGLRHCSKRRNFARYRSRIC